MKKFSFNESLHSKHRQHIITNTDALKLINHLNEAEIEKSEGISWAVSDLCGKTIEQAAKDIEPVLGHQRMLIHGFICEIFNYRRIG